MLFVELKVAGLNPMKDAGFFHAKETSEARLLAAMSYSPSLASRLGQKIANLIVTTIDTAKV